MLTFSVPKNTTFPKKIKMKNISQESFSFPFLEVNHPENEFFKNAYLGVC